MTITMRQQMGQTVKELIESDERLVVVLAEISTGYFEGTSHPERVINVGIMEQTMTSVAAGMALEGFIPVVHSITPFLVERPFEQIKDDFCYQGLGGKFISTGASYDYSTEGMTHHGPGDVQILRSLPGMQIVVPGTATEFERLFRETYANGSPTYYRLASTNNPVEYPVRFGKLEVVQRGSQATVIAVGPMLAATLEAVKDMDVTVLYCTTVAPFDAERLRAVCQGQTSKIVLVEPYYAGVLVPDICAAMGRIPVSIEAIGVPREVLWHYGTPEEHDEAIGLTKEGIRRRIERFLSE
ncbi:MAG TPA: transketolase C-terminal domain-containing protein [Ktedonobacteraceae bacterium]|nr:transketolase C-terminal domain-containing protein [Ktedonobacteraceae bacterium]